MCDCKITLFYSSDQVEMKKVSKKIHVLTVFKRLVFRLKIGFLKIFLWKLRKRGNFYPKSPVFRRFPEASKPAPDACFKPNSVCEIGVFSFKFCRFEC